MGTVIRADMQMGPIMKSKKYSLGARHIPAMINGKKIIVRVNIVIRK
jgi:urease accessory protein UreE